MIKRLNNVSLLRAISFLFIFIFHILALISPYKGEYFFPFYFTIQTFLFLSAYLYSKKSITNVKSFYIKNFIKILVPLNIFFVFELILCLIVNHVVANPFNWIGYLQTSPIALGHLWFIPHILVAYLILPLLQLAFNKIHNKNKLAKILIPIILILEIIISCFIDLQITLLPFFLGYLFGKKQEKLTTSKNKINFAILNIILFLLFQILYFITRNILITNNQLLAGLQICLINISSAMLGVTFAIAFLILFEFLNKFENIKILKFTDKYAFNIYFYHHIFLVGTLSLLFITPYIALNILLVVLSTVFSVVVMEIVNSKIVALFLNKKSFKQTKNTINTEDFKTNS